MQRILTFSFMGLIIAILIFWSHQRNADYRTEFGLWADTLMKSPDKPRVLVNFAIECKRKGPQFDELGLAALRKAIEIQSSLIPYLEALLYVTERGGRMRTEEDVWNTPGHRRKQGNMNPVLEMDGKLQQYHDRQTY